MKGEPLKVGGQIVPVSGGIQLTPQVGQVTTALQRCLPCLKLESWLFLHSIHFPELQQASLEDFSKFGQSSSSNLIDSWTFFVCRLGLETSEVKKRCPACDDH